jgi:hypothetical protein
LLEKIDDLFPAYRRKAAQKIINRVPRLEIVEKGLDWHTSAGEHWRTAHYIGVPGDHGVFHGLRLLPTVRVLQRFGQSGLAVAIRGSGVGSPH